MATEKRLIDAYKLEALVRRNRASYHNKDDVIAAIAGQPTVDAVEVVRCKDCKCRMYSDFDGCYVCHHGGFNAINPDHFCSYGERRTDERKAD